jgi:uncharacterized membrane protein YfcA
MLDWTTLFVAAVFVLAGLVKGVLGLGLPTIAMGLLALVVTPMEAAALLALPSLLTNLWQAAARPSLRAVIIRLWPMMLGVCLGTWAGAGLVAGAYARSSSGLLGLALALYALTGLSARHLQIDRRHEPWLGPAAGAVTGLITAATGVFVIPAVPYLQAIGLEKEELVQALGLSFTVSTIALAVNLTSAGALNVGVAGPALLALAMACAGMWVGQTLRRALQPATFRRWFFIGLLVLGIYLAARSVL